MLVGVDTTAGSPDNPSTHVSSSTPTRLAATGFGPRQPPDRDGAETRRTTESVCDSGSETWDVTDILIILGVPAMVLAAAAVKKLRTF